MSAKPSAKPTTAIAIDIRCKYVAASGRRCRIPVARDTSKSSRYSAFCLQHSQMEQQFLDSKSVAEELIGDLDDFRTYHSVSEVLGKLLILVANNRIPLRNATSIAYICQLLLTGAQGVRYETNLRGGKVAEVFAINRAMGIMWHEDDDESEDEEKDGKEKQKEEAKPALAEAPQQKAS